MLEENVDGISNGQNMPKKLGLREGIFDGSMSFDDSGSLENLMLRRCLVARSKCLKATDNVSFFHAA